MKKEAKKKEKKVMKREKRTVPKNAKEAENRFPWVGRYTEEMPFKLIEHFSQGRSFESFGGRDDVSAGKTTLYRWLTQYEEFKEAKEIGESKALYYFETLMSSIARGEPIKSKDGKVIQFDPRKSNHKLIMFILKTRFYKIYSERAIVETDLVDKTDTESVIEVEFVEVKK